MSDDVKAPDETPAPEPAAPSPPEPEPVAMAISEPEPETNGAELAAPHTDEPAVEPEPEMVTEDVAEDVPAVEEAPPAEEAPPPAEESKKHWYVVKVQSGREDTIKEAIERRAKKEGVEEFFGQIVIPVEKYTEIKTDKNGKRVTRTKERKLYPGYLMVEVEYNDRILYLFRETSGVGDFVGAHPGDLTRAPTPMTPREVERMIGKAGKPGDKEEPVSPKPKWLQEGDRVRVVDGTFNGMDGMVKKIKEHESKVEVELTIFGRPVAVDLEYYQVEQL
jgi:transcriptional antiterminator NusG